jgi:chaperone required for assembly of F1-ATPase
MVERGYQPDDILKAMQNKAVQNQDTPWYIEALSNVNSEFGSRINL